MDDVVTPRFKERMAAGEIINNPYNYHRLVTTKPTVTSYVHNQLLVNAQGCIYGSVYSGQSSMTSDAMQPFLTVFSTQEWADTKASLINQAVTRAHSNASSAEIGALVTAAEAEKTVVSIAQILKRVFRIIRAARKGDILYLKKQISYKELEDRYLELRYALRPLMYDASNAQSAFRESKAFKTFRKTYRGFAHESGTSQDTYIGYSDPISTEISRICQWVCEARAGVLCDIETSNTSVFGLDQIPESIWELVPFSFIIDWFLNIGDTIAAWTPSAGVREKTSWVVVESYAASQNSLVRQWYSGSNPFNYRNDIVWGSLSKSQDDIYRERIVVPQLSLLPTVNVRLNTLKILDLAAIIRKRGASLLR
jgi:hypothetical protein